MAPLLARGLLVVTPNMAVEAVVGAVPHPGQDMLLAQVVALFMVQEEVVEEGEVRILRVALEELGVPILLEPEDREV